MHKKRKNAEKVKRGPTNQPTNRRTDGPTKRGVESRNTQLKTKYAVWLRLVETKIRMKNGSKKATLTHKDGKTETARDIE